jgi:hypothetical protein
MLFISGGRRSSSLTLGYQGCKRDFERMMSFRKNCEAIRKRFPGLRAKD